MMNYDKLKEYTIFFYELQSHGIIVYDDFFRLVTHFGLRDPETMTQLLLILPPNNYTQIIRKKIQMIFLKSKEANEKEELFKKYCQDIENYYEEAIHTLPPYFLYQIGYLILNNKEFTFYQKSKMLSQMNLLHMIIPLFKTEEKPIFTVLSVLQMRHLIPLLYSYNCINKFLELVINDSTSRYVEICFLMNQFKKPSSYFKKYEEKIIEIRDKVKLDVSIKTVSELFTEFSYLCNVHILNDFYNVRTVSDLQKSLHCFLSNLLTFNLLNVDYLWKFYLAFIESLCVLPQSWKFFIEVLFYVLLFDYIEITEKIKNVIYEFIYRVISKRIINGCEYLNSIYDIFVSVRIDIDNCENANFLFDILRDIVQEHSYLFTLTNLLSDSVANWLTVSHQYIRDIISPLSNRPVIITESVKHNLLGPPSNFSALVFLLVPKELMVPNMKDVFTYYRMNITNQTMILWTIFLRSRPLYIFESVHEKRIVYYVDGIKYPEGVEVDVKRDIIKPNHVLPEYPDDYRTKISVAFYKLTNIPENSDPTKMNIYLEAWRILCENQKIALLSEQHLIKDLGKPDFSYSPASFNSLRQMFSHLNEVKYEEVCKILFSANVDIRFESELADSQLKFIASFFLMYFAKFGASSSSSNFIIASEKLLKWLPEMYEGQLKSTQFVLDCFNFFTAATANRDNAFQERVRKSTKESIKKIKGKLRNILLLNNPPQKYISKTEPLYLNQEPPISTGDLSSMNTSNSNLNDIFPLDDDDDTLWMC
ncbi:hypothetical protein TRFO_03853 [Tritrichomonas foetus]|uniref:Uncharacterized protein n=1 Tax=Tritrichomonas foetus TaxID=1144522 RepID=A0A1J4KK22_9EUKA|nr:hypothetical protein TRFO_03853 [Tritrichomonas foetus]|eukprot:OHT11649.1 hypothetical protein TRFO_03853 [Tritrichomonas foetus]